MTNDITGYFPSENEPRPDRRRLPLGLEIQDAVAGGQVRHRFGETAPRRYSSFSDGVRPWIRDEEWNVSGRRQS